MRSAPRTPQLVARAAAWAVTLAILLLSPGAARAQCSPTPSWALGRDSSCRLMVDSGSLGTVTFRTETEFAGVNSTGGQGTWRCANLAPDITQGDNKLCDVVVYDSTYDNAKNGFVQVQCGLDVRQIKEIDKFRHVFLKNFKFRNAYRYRVNGPWGGNCSSAHTDTFQSVGPPSAGGWVVFQDGFIINSDTAIIQWEQMDRGYGGNPGSPAWDDSQAPGIGLSPGLAIGGGGILFQGVVVGNESAATGDVDGDGQANWQEGCAARGNSICNGNHLNIRWQTGANTSYDEIWFVDVDNISSINFTLQDSSGSNHVAGKVVVVGGSGGDANCSACWANTSNPSCGPARSCNQWEVGSAHYYENMEAAIADGHTAPPFSELSSSGWAAAPGSPPPPLSAPTQPVLTD